MENIFYNLNKFLIDSLVYRTQHLYDTAYFG